MNIAFYVSNHGFGHIMRNIPVIAYLLEHTDNKVVLVTAHKHTALAKQYLERDTSLTEEELAGRFVSIEQDVDLGLIVKPGTLIVDEEALQAEVSEYVGKFPQLIAVAKNLFRDYSIDRVVVDIVPWALTAAKESGLLSYLMASFTWIEQYVEFLPEELIAPFRRCFADVDSVLLYDLVNEPTRNRYPYGTEVGFVARPFHEDKVREIKGQFGGRPIVFLSLGGSNSGLDFDIDVNLLPYTFISTEGMRLKGENVHFLPVNINNTQDYVAASDFCISKAGWSTISEMMLAGKPMALLERPDVSEDRMSIEKLLSRNAAIQITVDDLKSMGNVLQVMKDTEWCCKKYKNGCVNIVKNIIA